MSDAAEVRERPLDERVAAALSLRQPAAAPVRPSGPRRLRRGVAWLAGAALSVLAEAVVLALAAALSLFWWVAQGPVEVGWLFQQAASRIGNPADPNRPQVGRATLRWSAFDQGGGQPLELDLRDLRIMGLGPIPAATLAHANLLLLPGPLLREELAPRAIVLDGLRLRLLRDRDGRVDLDDGTPVDAGPPAGSLVDTIALLRQPVPAEEATSGNIAVLAQLATVQAHDVEIQVQDSRLGAVLRLEQGDVDLQRQPGGGVLGTAAAGLWAGDVSSQMTLRADLGEAGAGTRLAASLTPVSPAALARAAPGLAPLAPLDALVGASATLDLSPGLAPRAASVQAEAGAGRLALPAASLAFEGLSLAAAAAWTGAEWGRPNRLQVSRAQAVIASPRGGWPTTVAASGEAVQENGGIRAEVAATLDHAAFADLPALWPAAWGGHVRPWLVENLTAGTVRNGRFTATVLAGADGSRPRMTAAGGSLLGDGVTIHWLRPVPPIERAQAVLTLLNPDVLEIALPSARQGAAMLSNGLVRITGLSVKDQDLALSADVQATVPDLLTLLKHPRLHLLDRKPINVQRPAGALAGNLRITLPLERDLQFEEVDIHAKGRMTGLRLGGLVAGRDLDRGDVTVDVTTKALHASGQAAVGGIPAAVSVDMDFRDGGPAQVVQQATAAGRATAGQLASAGLDLTGLVGAGQAGFKAAYTARRDGQATVAVQSDLRDVALSAAGWTKAPGQPASASVQLAISNDRLQGIRELHAEGPGMMVHGRAEMVGDRPLRLVLDPIHLGPTRARGEIRLPARPGEPIRATLDGAVLDLSQQMARKPPARLGVAREEPSTPFVADVRFDRVLLSGTRGVGGVTAHAENDGRRLSVLQVQSSGPEQVRLSIAPRGTGRAVSLRAADAGGLARAMDIMDSMDGGTIALEAQYDDTRPDPPLSGTVAINGFHVRDAPGVGKLLQALTVYGIGEAMSGPGLLFSQLTAPFRWEGGVLTVREARAFSASLGLTAEGRIDTGAKTLDLKGTVVPAYMLNSALGRLPVVGRLFSAERGGGLVAVNYGYRGPIANPSVSVNPLSALTPGFLRGLFKMFD